MNIKIIAFLIFLSGVSAAQSVTIGAKHFNEGYLLAEILAQYLEENDITVDRKFNLGGTLICFSALKNGEIDLYPEYTGTIAEQILHSSGQMNWLQLRDSLHAKYRLNISEPYGFNNTYAIAVRQKMAQKLNLKNISDLVNFPELKFAFSYEFLKRQDGWENLAAHYNMTQSAVGIEHGLAYQAIADQSVDVMDVYSTDGEIPRYDLKILDDDKSFFPQYQAVTFFRNDLPMTTAKLLRDLD